MVSISKPAVTFSGVASGIDTTAVIQALVDVRARPIGKLEQRRGELEAAKKIWADLDDKVDALEDKLRPLKYRSRFLKNTASVSNDSVLTAKSSGSAAPGSYQITVNNLATAGSVGSQVYTDSDTLTVGTGTLSLTMGDTTTDITIDSTNDTLDGVAQAINDSQADVTAAVIATEPGGPYRLVITGNETGADNGVSLDASGLSGGTQAISTSSLQAAEDAQITVNGLTVDRASNTITDVVEGLTLKLVSEGATSTVTVTLDMEKVRETLDEFVNAYNDVFTLLDEQLSYDKESGDAPPLLGDFSLRGIQRRVQTVLKESIDPGDGNAITLNLLGIRSTKEGTLEIDTEDFEDALEGGLEGTNLDDITDFFTKSETGLAAKLQGVLDIVTDPVDGTIAVRKKAITTNVENINDSIDTKQIRLNAYEDSLRRKYSRFEELMGRLQSQQNYLTQQLMMR